MLPSQPSIMGHYRPASETPFKWRFAGGPVMTRCQLYLDQQQQQNLLELDPL